MIYPVNMTKKIAVNLSCFFQLVVELEIDRVCEDLIDTNAFIKVAIKVMVVITIDEQIEIVTNHEKIVWFRVKISIIKLQIPMTIETIHSMITAIHRCFFNRYTLCQRGKYMDRHLSTAIILCNRALENTDTDKENNMTNIAISYLLLNIRSPLKVVLATPYTATLNRSAML